MTVVDKALIDQLNRETMAAFEKIHQKCADKLGISMEELNKQIYIYHCKNGRFKNINPEQVN